MLLSPALLACLFLPAQPNDEKVHVINQRTFRVPVQVDASRREEIRHLELYVSRDQGKTWEPCTLLDPVRDSFMYTAKTDGVFWFAVRLSLHNEKYEPAEISDLIPALKVSVVEKQAIPVSTLPEAPKVSTPPEAPKVSTESMAEEIVQLRAELKRLKDRVTTLERLLKDRQP